MAVTESTLENAERPYQFRSEIANQIQQTLKSRFNREIQFNHDEMLPEMNITDEDEEERHTTRVRVLKNRFSGLTGPACRLLYNKQTGRMTERFDEDAL